MEIPIVAAIQVFVILGYKVAPGAGWCRSIGEPYGSSGASSAYG
jgi:hypothetical protein